MSRSEILDILRAQLRQVKQSLPVELGLDARFRAELGLDSLELIEYVARMEQVFRVQIPDDDWQALSTLALAADYVEGQLRS
jgi:acyl carrier protein